MKSIFLVLGLLAFSCAAMAQPTITTSATLPAGTTGVAYSQQLVASGGSGGNTWEITPGTLGAPPAGLGLSSGGLISGTPTSYGTSTFSVTVVDNSNNSSAPVIFSLTINPAPLLISTGTALPAGLTETPYSQSLAATGGVTPYTWAVTAGALPAAVALFLWRDRGERLSQRSRVVHGHRDGFQREHRQPVVFADDQYSAHSPFPRPRFCRGAWSKPDSTDLGRHRRPSSLHVVADLRRAPGGRHPFHIRRDLGHPTAAGTFTPTIEVIDTAVLEAARLDLYPDHWH